MVGHATVSLHSAEQMPMVAVDDMAAQGLPSSQVATLQEQGQPEFTAQSTPMLVSVSVSVAVAVFVHAHLCAHPRLSHRRLSAPQSG